MTGWKSLAVKRYGSGPISLVKHYKKDNIHVYIYKRGNDLEVIRGKIVRSKFKKTYSRTVKDTFDNYKKLIKKYR